MRRLARDRSTQQQSPPQAATIHDDDNLLKPTQSAPASPASPMRTPWTPSATSPVPGAHSLGALGPYSDHQTPLIDGLASQVLHAPSGSGHPSPDLAAQAPIPSSRPSPFAGLFTRRGKQAAATSTATSSAAAHETGVATLNQPIPAAPVLATSHSMPPILSANALLSPSASDHGQPAKSPSFGSDHSSGGSGPPAAAASATRHMFGRGPAASASVTAAEAAANAVATPDINTLISNLHDDEEGCIFGVPLEVAVARAGKRGVPDIVVACLEHLERTGLTLEGLYRVPGSARRVREWTERFEQAAAESRPEPAPAASTDGGVPPSTVGPSVALDGESPSTVASLLKKFLLRLKGGLMGDGRFWKELEPLVAGTSASLVPNSPESVELILTIRGLLKSCLPTPCHLRTLARYLIHLNRVAAFSEQNKMTPQNLAIVAFPGGRLGAELLIGHAPEIFFGWEECGWTPERPRTSSLPATTNLSAGGSPSLAAESVTPVPDRSTLGLAADDASAPPPPALPPPAWMTEKPREFSEQSFAAAKQAARYLADAEALERAGHLQSGTAAAIATAAAAPTFPPGVTPPPVTEAGGTAPLPASLVVASTAAAAVSASASAIVTATDPSASGLFPGSQPSDTSVATAARLTAASSTSLMPTTSADAAAGSAGKTVQLFDRPFFVHEQILDAEDAAYLPATAVQVAPAAVGSSALSEINGTPSLALVSSSGIGPRS
ncbi:Rho GTPase-activating protein syde1 [Cladochytrium tenue]|nr:Rho GTPase-activating protein syde1 [Cladochytrium tenue]